MRDSTLGGALTEEQLHEMQDELTLKLDPPPPPGISESGRALLDALLNKEQAARLGTRGGAAEILAHPFIAAHVDVDGVRARTSAAPLVPALDAVNAATIDEVGEMERATKVKLDAAHFRQFAGWEFRDERLMQAELIEAIENEGVDPKPPDEDDGCASCCLPGLGF